MRADTEKAIREFDIKTFGNLKNIEAGEELLDPGERVLFASPSNFVVAHANTRKKDKSPGVVFLTDKRVVFFSKVLASFSSESLSLEEIHSVNCYGNGLSGGHIEVHTLTKTYDILVTYKKEVIQKIRDLFEGAKSGYSAQPLTVSAADELLKFKALMDDGIITPEEFAAKKKQLLGL